MRIPIFLFALFLFILAGLSRADEPPEIRMAVLPGNVGLAMVKMMDQPAAAGFTARFELGGSKKHRVARS